MLYIWAFIAFLVLISIVFVVTIILNHFGTSIPLNQIELELFKSALQFVLVGVAGAVVATLLRLYESGLAQALKEVENKRQKAEKQREAESRREMAAISFLKDFHTNMIATYNQTKLVRRLLRAESTLIQTDQICTYRITEDDYDKLFRDLEFAQLGLETHKHMAAANKAHLTLILGDGNKIYHLLKTAEEYIGKVIKEYENREHTRSNGEVSISKSSVAFTFIAPSSLLESIHVADTSDERYFSPMGQLEKIIVERISRDIIPLQ
jgi:hypothetical protein